MEIFHTRRRRTKKPPAKGEVFHTQTVTIQTMRWLNRFPIVSGTKVGKKRRAAIPISRYFRMPGWSGGPGVRTFYFEIQKYALSLQAKFLKAGRPSGCENLKKTIVRMQDLKALEGKNLAELREIAKTLGIDNVMVKKRELIDKIVASAQSGAPAAVETTPEAAPAVPAAPARAARGRRPRLPKSEAAAPVAEPGGAAAVSGPRRAK